MTLGGNANKVVEQLDDPLDWAIVLIAGSVGFILDASLNPIGFLTASQTGITTAALSLGFRKSAQSRGNRRRHRRDFRRLAKLCAEAGMTDLVRIISTELDLVSAGVLDEGAADESLREVRSQFAERLRGRVQEQPDVTIDLSDRPAAREIEAAEDVTDAG